MVVGRDCGVVVLGLLHGIQRHQQIAIAFFLCVQLFGLFKKGGKAALLGIGS